MSESIFLSQDGFFVPTAHARGPWDPEALHGGAPAALIATAFEQMHPGVDLRIGRLGFELLRPIPFAPLSISTRIVRAGRRVQELAAELRAGDELICRASALRVREVPDGVPETDSGGRPRAPAERRRASGGEWADTMSGPDDGREIRFSLDGGDADSFAGSAMEMRWLSDPRALGPGRVWMRMRHPLLPDEPASALARLAATADFSNGVSAALPFEGFLFINADLSVHLQRAPLGEWIGLDARTLLHAGGPALAESVIYDEHGAVGRAFQTLVVQPR